MKLALAQTCPITGDIDAMVVARTSIAVAIGVLLASMALGETPDRPVGIQLAFDRNQLRDVRVAGSNAVALTVAGHLLRFSVPDLVLHGESLSDEPVVALGQGSAGEILAVRGNEVLRVDPTSLALTKVAAFPEPVIWAQRDRENRLLAITERSVREQSKGETSERRVRTLRRAGLKAIAVPAEDGVAHLSSRGEVFLGADKGEWGGWIAHVDLRSGIVSTKKDNFDGVYGFVDTEDGRTLAYGGTSHMGYCGAFVAEVRADGGKRTLFSSEFGECDENRPAPITGLAALPGGHFLGVSYSTFYDVSPDIRSWTKRATARVRYVWGRPDAVGSYPAIGPLRVLMDSPLQAIAITRLNGLLSIARGEIRTHEIPGQLGVQSVNRIESAAGSIALFESLWELPAWTRNGLGWIPRDAMPSEKPPEGRGWNRACAFQDKDGTIVQLYAENVMPGQMITARLTETNLIVLSRDTSPGFMPDCLGTADGTWWILDDHILRHDRDAWRVVGEGLQWRSTPEAPPTRLYGPFRSIAQDASARWLLHGHDSDGKGRLVWLAPPRDGTPAALSRVEVREAGKALAVRSALAWGEGQLLLATDRGIRVASISNLEASTPTFAAGIGDVKLLGRDGWGRTWLIGERIYVRDDQTGEIARLASVPILERSTPEAIGADPSSPDGMLVSLGKRGLLTLRTSNQAPAPEAGATPN